MLGCLRSAVSIASCVSAAGKASGEGEGVPDRVPAQPQLLLDSSGRTHLRFAMISISRSTWVLSVACCSIGPRSRHLSASKKPFCALSRARYTRPYLPLPRGLPISKSLSLRETPCLLSADLGRHGQLVWRGGLGREGGTPHGAGWEGRQRRTLRRWRVGRERWKRKTHALTPNSSPMSPVV